MRICHTEFPWWGKWETSTDAKMHVYDLIKLTSKTSGPKRKKPRSPVSRKNGAHFRQPPGKNKHYNNGKSDAISPKCDPSAGSPLTARNLESPPKEKGDPQQAIRKLGPAKKYGGVRKSPFRKRYDPEFQNERQGRTDRNKAKRQRNTYFKKHARAEITGRTSRPQEVAGDIVKNITRYFMRFAGKGPRAAQNGNAKEEKSG